MPSYAIIQDSNKTPGIVMARRKTSLTPPWWTDRAVSEIEMWNDESAAEAAVSKLKFNNVRIVSYGQAVIMIAAQKRELDEAPTPTFDLKGKRVVFTGALKYGTRVEMEETARDLGATIQKAVNTATDYLIVGERAGSKLKQAERLGVAIITEEEWNTLLLDCGKYESEYHDY